MKTRDEALNIVKKYNKEPFHVIHAITVECVMRYFAHKNNYDENYWGLIGLLHDIDFEIYPEEHCVAAERILREEGFTDEIIKSVCSHGYGETNTPHIPEHYMEKVLFAVDELTGLIGAAARMRPSKSTKDMELSSLKKKFKDKKFAAGCSREIIQKGAEILGMELDDLLQETILAMRECEDKIALEAEKVF